MQIASGGFIDVNDSFAQEATIKALDSEEDDVKIASIFVLGHITDVEILPKLFTLWTNTDLSDNEKAYFRFS